MTSRALVLGGGGLVGVAYESGLLRGFADAGLDLAAADLVLGTSAGSIVGSLLRLGEQPEAALGLLAAGGPTLVPPAGMSAFFEDLVAVSAEASSPEDARRRLGRVAVSAPTASEEEYVALFSAVEERPWPPGFACTAVDVETGQPKVWDAESGISLDRAVASSCAVPALFPPVTIGGRRWMDGGMRTALNAGLASGHDLVLAISCFALELPPGMSDPMVEGLNAQIREEIDGLRAAGAEVGLVVPGPEMLEASGWGLEAMNEDRVAAGWEAGLAQSARELELVGRLWAA